jgi:inorganic triphosphatase YgiF
MTDMREVEAKFEVDPESIQRLERVTSIGRFGVVSRRMVSQDDLYFDTAGGALAQARASLRVRRRADGAELTFKGSRDVQPADSEAHIASRLEDEISIATDVADRISCGEWLPDDERLSPIARARPIAGLQRLVPTARVLNDRVVVKLVLDDREELELAIDTCEGTRLSDGRVIRFNELELEAKQASRETVIDAAAELQIILPGIRPNHRTKLERILQ